eukprot:4207875-Prymnesium_polylepis.1
MRECAIEERRGPRNDLCPAWSVHSAGTGVCDATASSQVKSQSRLELPNKALGSPRPQMHAVPLMTSGAGLGVKRRERLVTSVTWSSRTWVQI